MFLFVFVSHIVSFSLVTAGWLVGWCFSMKESFFWKLPWKRWRLWLPSLQTSVAFVAVKTLNEFWSFQFFKRWQHFCCRKNSKNTKKVVKFLYFLVWGILKLIFDSAFAFVAIKTLNWLWSVAKSGQLNNYVIAMIWSQHRSRFCTKKKLATLLNSVFPEVTMKAPELVGAIVASCHCFCCHRNSW